MSKNLPNINRRPAGLTAELEQSILSAAEGITADAVKEFMTAKEQPTSGAVAELIKSRPVLAKILSSVWWCLERRDMEAALKSQMGSSVEIEKPMVSDETLNEVSSRLRARYIYSTFRDAVWDRRARAWISTRAMDFAEMSSMPLNERGNPISAFATMMRDQLTITVHNERYVPGETAEIVYAEDVYWLNVWKAPKLLPVAGDPLPMLNHILYLCNGDKSLASHMTNWLAYTYQNPGKKINHAVLMISPRQGVGKDTVAIAMSRLLGETNVPFIDDDALAEGRNEFLKAASLIVVPEVMSGDRRDVANKLKPLITQETVRVNEKNVQPYFVRNTANLMMFSNHEHAAHIEDNDRRYFVVICKQDLKDQAYYDALYEYIEGPALAGFAHHLATRDLSSFNPKAPAPHTEDKDTVRKATRGGVEAWLDDAWQSRAEPFHKDVINLREALTQIANAKGPRMTVQQVAVFLKKMGGGDMDRRRLNGQQVRVWAIRDFEKVAALSSDQLDAIWIEGKDWEDVVHMKTGERVVPMPARRFAAE